jgi:hypothetical protein
MTSRTVLLILLAAVAIAVAALCPAPQCGEYPRVTLGEVMLLGGC